VTCASAWGTAVTATDAALPRRRPRRLTLKWSVSSIERSAAVFVPSDNWCAAACHRLCPHFSDGGGESIIVSCHLAVAAARERRHVGD
jgi:hypothetical protein